MIKIINLSMIKNRLIINRFSTTLDDLGGLVAARKFWIRSPVGPI